MRKYTYIILSLILVLALFSKKRFDLTSDHRYTLAGTTHHILTSVQNPLHITVYLKGDFPSYFKKLQYETAALLEQFRALNSRITYTFVNPLEKKGLADKLKKEGMIPAEISVQQKDRLQTIPVFPWAEISYDNKKIHFPLLVNTGGIPVEEQINRSIERLEYAFTYNIHKLTRKQKPAIAILKGNGELEDIYIADFLRTLHDFYRLAPFTLDSVATNPSGTLEELKKFDLVIIAKPQKAFTHAEKFTLDQYLMHGGTMMLLIDPVKANKDTLMFHHRTYALNAELNLTDWLFAYGVRPEPVLVKDLQAAPVAIEVGKVGKNPQLENFPWFYAPLVQPNPHHPVGKNTGKVKLDFVSLLDTLPRGPRKTVLLESSPYTQVIGVPVQINFEEIAKKPDVNAYHAGKKIFGILLEGIFKSAYANRVKPFKTDVKDSARTKMILIADGDIIKNDVIKGRPLPLGLDKWSRMQFDNKNFLLNAVNYLTDKNGLFLLNNKVIHMALIDKNKAVAEGTFWRRINMFVPVLLILIPLLFFRYKRMKKYSHPL